MSELITYTKGHVVTARVSKKLTRHSYDTPWGVTLRANDANQSVVFVIAPGHCTILGAGDRVTINDDPRSIRLESDKPCRVDFIFREKTYTLPKRGKKR